MDTNPNIIGPDQLAAAGVDTEVFKKLAVAFIALSVVLGIAGYHLGVYVGNRIRTALAARRA